MADLPHPWGIYAQIQDQLDRHTVVDDRAYGLEAGLDKIIDELTSIDVSMCERAIATGSRRERHRKSALTNKALVGGKPDDPLRQLEARSALDLIETTVHSGGVAILKAVAAGHSYTELAAKYHGTSGAFRARVARLRRHLFALAA